MLTKNRRKATQRVVDANRRNAKKSTGPRTEEGKRKVAMNRFKHGFYATPDRKTREQMFSTGEDPRLTDALRAKPAAGVAARR